MLRSRALPIAAFPGLQLLVSISIEKTAGLRERGLWEKSPGKDDELIV